MSRWEGDFCGEFAQDAEIGRQPRRPQAGERGAPRGGRPEGGRSPPGCRPIQDPRRVYWSQGVCSSLPSPSSKVRASRAFWAMACRRASTLGKRRSGRRKWQRVTVSS